ncbi:MAG: nicotinate-nucleotide--dimethylbenzimidazole phosphoribosyltransferase [Armatimonadota bacterium]
MNLSEIIASIAPQDAEARARARARLEQLTMPHWALGRLMDMAEDLAGMTRTIRPSVENRVVVTMAGDHGVVAEGVSAYPQEVTPQMVYNFVNGGAGVNALARQSRTKVVVVDMGVAADLSDLGGAILHKKIAPGTQNIAKGPAMSREQAVQAVEAGIQVARELDADVYGTGEMGIGNTTPSSAIVAVICGKDPAEVTGRGTGIDDGGFARKVEVIREALAVNSPDPADALDVLAKVGGFEIAGIAGLVLGAASMRRPVLIDGFISTAGALVAYQLCPAAGEYMIAAHRSVEQGQRAALAHMGKEPLLDLNLRLGEGTGAALAMSLVEAAVAVLTEVATFEEAAVHEAL